MAGTKKVRKIAKPTAVAVATPAPAAGEYTGYCVKCKEKRNFSGKVEVSKTGMNMAKGQCPTCGTTVCRILGKA